MPLLPELENRMRNQLTFVYGATQAEVILGDLRVRMLAAQTRMPTRTTQRRAALTQDDAILITYGDQVSQAGQTPLQTLAATLGAELAGAVNAVHILPFYPYTSDDGFSVVDYTAVDPNLGSWDDVADLGRSGPYRLMFDAVINHISAASEWFQAFLRGEPGAEERFIIVDPATDLSLVTRPRTHPLLTRFETAKGERWVWTTFSTDQIDLNFANPAVLLAIIDVLLEYVIHGAEFIRLDAIGYMWKEIGTNCIHLPKAHRLVQLCRTVLDAVAPEVLLITETNVPHRDNISYFGDGSNEAQLVYQFPLAPLVLNAFATGDAHHLSGWAANLAPPSPTTAFFNFLASHDGLGVVPASGILSQAEVAALAAQIEKHGGRVSYKTNSDGSQSPYELNCTFFDALSDPASDEPMARKIDRFIASQAIMLALQGVPGIYIHSLLGSPNDQAGMAATGRARTINRRKWTRTELLEMLASERGSQVFERYCALLTARRAEPAFAPAVPQRILALGDQVFGVVRSAPTGESRVICVHSVANAPQQITLSASETSATTLRDLLSDATMQPAADGSLTLTLAPYQVLWLRDEF